MAFSKTNLITSFTGTLLVASFSSATMAAGMSSPSKRAERTEISFQVRYHDSVSMTTKSDINIDVNSDVSWAFGVGYNFSENLAFDFDVGWGDTGYTGTFIDENNTQQTYSNRLSSSNTNFGLTYNFLAKRFTPFIGASIGWAFLDSNIRDGKDQIYCEPIFPFYCFAFTPTKTSTEFTYGATLGVRFDVSKQMFFKGGVGTKWVDLGNARSTPSATIYHFTVGYMF
ncbi:hypothetical protein MNBD_GAMMA08-1743 [hydrothermal vent metagenome]|uniref:Outer membrane protein beta-barrel domain-containing protein n=1 Tax=hydrothermal vent metagenome TaxID=652676 RepID=A0A3B0XEC5_9ZZZZ